jgi:hypothetical protein
MGQQQQRRQKSKISFAKLSCLGKVSACKSSSQLDTMLSNEGSRRSQYYPPKGCGGSACDEMGNQGPGTGQFEFKFDAPI